MASNMERAKPVGPMKSSSKESVNNIRHKNSCGNSNWNRYVRMEGVKPDVKTVSQRKVPLMSSARYDGNHGVTPMGEVNWSSKLTKLIAMDCEMVGVGPNGAVSMLARVSLVNSNGDCVYDKYVKPIEVITDYRTPVSGIRPHHVESGENFLKVQKDVAFILKGRILVGHALHHDLLALMLRHSYKYTRDTASFQKFRKEVKGPVSLKNLTEQFLNVKIQTGEHNSVEDARAAMQLYMMYRKEWEQERREKWQSQKRNAKNRIEHLFS